MTHPVPRNTAPAHKRVAELRLPATVFGTSSLSVRASKTHLRRARPLLRAGAAFLRRGLRSVRTFSALLTLETLKIPSVLPPGAPDVQYA